MAKRAFAYSLTVGQVGPVHDPDYLRASSAVKAEVKRWIVVYGLKEKDRDLAAGLDKEGKPLRPIALATRAHRESAMGPADPNAPPLMPAYAVSRTRLLLEGEPTSKGAHFWWGYDPHTGDEWGKILDYHRRGIGVGHRIKRDVIGLSPDAVARVREQVLKRWKAWKRAGLRLGWQPRPKPLAKVPELVTTGRVDFHNFTYGIGGTGAPGVGVRTTGFRQRRPGGGLTAFGGPGTSPTPRITPPKPKPRPKPPKPKPQPIPEPPAPIAQGPPAPPTPALGTPILPGRPIAERIAAYGEGERLRRAVIEAEGATNERIKEQEALRATVQKRLNRAVRDAEKATDASLREKAEARIREANQSLRGIQDNIDLLRKPLIKRIVRETLAVPTPARIDASDAHGPFPEKYDPLTDANQRAWIDGQAFVEAITHTEPGSTYAVWRGQIKQGDEQRAYYSDDLNTVAIKVGDTSDVIAHELGHFLENHLRLLGRTLEFLKHRVGAEQPQRLIDVIPNSEYQPDEVGRSDRFAEAFGERQAWYVGKKYINDYYTEILAMGTQKLYNDPVGFAKADPEFFKFIVGLLRGALR